MSSQDERKIPSSFSVPEDVVQQIQDTSRQMIHSTRRVSGSYGVAEKLNAELEKAFVYNTKKPVVFDVHLPSRGLLYGGKLPDGVIKVSPLTARDEKLLAGATGDIEDVIDTLFERHVETKDVPIQDFLSSDRLYTLLLLRANSYGKEYSFELQCGFCNFVYQETLCLPDDLDVKFLEDNVQEPFEVILPASDKVVGFHLLRGRDEKTIIQYKKRILGRHKAAKNEGDPAYTYRIALMIDYLEGVDVSSPSLVQRKMEFVENLIGEDSAALQQAILDSDCGVSPEISTKCPQCGREGRQMFPFTADFFRPTRGK